MDTFTAHVYSGRQIFKVKTILENVRLYDGVQ